MPRPEFKKQNTLLDEIIRVDHAGEYGARRIYQGQIAACRNKEDMALLSKMLKQEEVHLEFFTKAMQERKIRPTLLLPLWHFGGYALGFVTSLMGKKTAMLCTEAVEEVIDEHYSQQLLDLQNNQEEQLLKNKIEQFREEELEHRDIAIEHGSTEAPGYKIIHQVIKSICRTAISISKRV
jgi:3-demethoxyubiquinol 3-hydroxylase